MKSGAIFFFVLLLSTFGTVKGQNETDALRFSEHTYLGTARVIGVGGAFGALGGDFGGLAINPATLGVFKSSNFSISPALFVRQTNSEFYSGLADQQSSKILLSSCGIVSAVKKDDSRKTSWNFAIGYNRTADFDGRLGIEGQNSGSSLADVFVNTANGTNSAELTSIYRFGAGLAWVAYLIDPAFEGATDIYASAVPTGATKQQTKQIDASGSMGEVFAALSAELTEKLHLGLSAGFPTIRYYEQSRHEETLQNPGTELASFHYSEDLSTAGNGLNMKLGLLYRATELLRLGVGYHSPNFYSMELTYFTEVGTVFRDGQIFDVQSPTGVSEYKLRTPQRFILSAAFMTGKRGFVSADYEFSDYASATLRATQGSDPKDAFRAQNEQIVAIYRGAHNARVGSEFRINEFVFLRAGIRINRNPFSSSEDRVRSFEIAYTGGAGFRVQGFYADLGGIFGTSSRYHYPYNPQMVQAALINQMNVGAVMTLGFKY